MATVGPGLVFEGWVFGEWPVGGKGLRAAAVVVHVVGVVEPFCAGDVGGSEVCV